MAEYRTRLASPDATAEWGRTLGSLLRAGDLVLLHGELGAGKTTLTRSLAEGLGVRGPITSPTFVLARTHPSVTGGPSLVHVDAYRLGGDAAALDDLDLDASLDEAVTVIEWGAGMAEGLSSARLDIYLTASPDESRQVRAVPVGERFESLVSALPR
ncbi:tRNA threonylcarbamoyladenosine biosynthesis protein TsaE [Branchiibius hedensis]|uniref:tRNA threonylcarbamoyladenosine biosynthesis protein TsaE n=1 Tax=Branchiibius hedensis TaxID=672460 RepID=A0A2Y8ZRJ8_9MICO|nr:tRNA (adenosine(37)-N6)-threonylcarbamoyltransferase complex ATPase subunit type 1 TsaE [Branchiibius hedensis]PWJ26198.1 tRNA threonylcarbamoyladenosine biosynthesis protein TsaE [Branchiibius hedensis]SSA35010.1 tRNA threonylcarbamoyladenosine biosynthesis protein TsaE [Branchiibius hedensis]